MNDGIYTARYIGKPFKGYKPRQVYQINIEKAGYIYNLESLGEENNSLLQYSSEISIRQDWRIFDETETE